MRFAYMRLHICMYVYMLLIYICASISFIQIIILFSFYNVKTFYK